MNNITFNKTDIQNINIGIQYSMFFIPERIKTKIEKKLLSVDLQEAISSNDESTINKIVINILNVFDLAVSRKAVVKLNHIKENELINDIELSLTSINTILNEFFKKSSLSNLTYTPTLINIYDYIHNNLIYLNKLKIE